MPSAKNQLVVFDFDWSLVDQDTDRYLFEVLDPELRKLLNSRKTTMQWTDNVADCLQKLWEHGNTKDHVIEAFRSLPLHPAMKRAIQKLSEFKTIKTTFLILSNSNSQFIDIVLQHHGLDKSLFREIITNPASWDLETGMLKLQRRIPHDSPNQHQCRLGCSPNMCKGAELTAFLERAGGRHAFDRISYIGDGGNDYCPVVQLHPGDFALVRKHRELAARIASEKKAGNGSHLSCNTLEWDGAWEVEQVFLTTLSS